MSLRSTSMRLALAGGAITSRVAPPARARRMDVDRSDMTVISLDREPSLVSVFSPNREIPASSWESPHAALR